LGAGWLLLIAILVIGGVTSAVIWGIGVATSNIKGAGDLEKINNSAENRRNKQEQFEKLYAAVETNKGLVAQHKANVEANPNDQTAKQTFEGVKSLCINSVNKYNAEARKVTSMDWKAADLPESLTTHGCN
jgi:hypothetical protein